MYATAMKVQAHKNICGDGPRLDELVESYLKGVAMEAWEEKLANVTLDCLSLTHAFVEPTITKVQITAFKETLK